jgi:hypothetical protein
VFNLEIVMVLTHLIDGTRETKYGMALKKAFGEIAKYQRVQVTPYPGSNDMESFNLVKAI